MGTGSTSCVGIVRCDSAAGVEDARLALTELLDLIGGLDSLVGDGDVVLLKPNVGFEMDYRTGATTNVRLIEALALMTQQCGARRVIVGEGAAVGKDTRKAFEVNGYLELSSRLGLELVDFKREEHVALPVPGGKAFRRLHVPRIVVESDVIINVPVMKTHDALPVTLGLKNMKGVLREVDKKRFHRRGLAQSIVDLNKVVSPDLTIVDGTIGMEGLGPSHGDPVGAGVLVGSFDVVAADVVAGSIMGFGVDELDYLQLAAREGLGCADMDRIRVMGSPVSEVRRPFRRCELDPAKYLTQGIRIHEAGACSGCRHLVEGFLAVLERGEQLSLTEGKTLVFGQSVRLPAKAEGELVLLGKCTKQLVSHAAALGVHARYVPGCPPHPLTVRAALEKAAPREKS